MALNIASVERIFSEALELPSAGARAAFLDRACSSDPELRRQVESLIEVHERAGPFLAAPTICSEPVQAEPVDPIVGPYTLIEPIGEGGMGVVYVAEQTEPVRRKVALKVIKPGMDSRQVVARSSRPAPPGPGDDGSPEHRQGSTPGQPGRAAPTS
ncbi:MAG: hypothetical protein U0790_24920 [Isosphaeraceae bacterium]